MTVGELVVRLSANTADFHRKWTQVDRTLKRSGREWERTGRSLTRAFTLPLAAATGAMLLYQVNWRKLGESVGKEIGRQSREIAGMRDRINELKTTATNTGKELLKTLMPVIDNLISALKPLLELLQQAMQRFNELDPAIKRTAGDMALIAALAGPATSLIGKILLLVSALGKLHPAVAIIGLLAIGGVYAWEKWGRAAKEATEQATKGAEEAGTALSDIVNYFDEDWLWTASAEQLARAWDFRKRVAVDNFKREAERVSEILNPDYRPRATPRGAAAVSITDNETEPLLRFANRIPTYLSTIRTFAAEFANKFTDMNQVMQEWGNQWARTVGDAIARGELLKVRFGDLVRSMIADIATLMTKLYFTQPLVNALQDWLLLERTPGGTRRVGAGSGGGVGGSGYVPNMGLSMPMVSVYNYAGVPITASAGRGVSGQGVVDIVVGTLKSEFARGTFDTSMTRYGARPIGRIH